jgi:stearoyl-CoA desaturase (delta-9 desaturase)
LALFSGVFELSWWGVLAVALALTHVAIVAVTVFLHRHQAHRALDVHPAASHFFRLWLWLTTGMKTRARAAVHRKHHAKCETAEDPHSPQRPGINRVLWGGVFLYVKEAANRGTVERHGQGTPDDWLERNVYSKFVLLGLTLTGVADVILFGIVPGVLIFVTQIVWIPFWAAGVINGIGHYWGYRNWATDDASTNIVPWGILIGGEELHNNHHAFVLSARLSSKWYELDVGWMYIRALELLGLATVRHLAPVPRFVAARPCVSLQTLQAVVANRYHVLASYAKSVKRIRCGEIATGLSESRALQTMHAIAPRARLVLGTLDGIARAARRATRGLVRARRIERHRTPRRVFTTPALLCLKRKLTSASPGATLSSRASCAGGCRPSSSSSTR